MLFRSCDGCRRRFCPSCRETFCPICRGRLRRLGAAPAAGRRAAGSVSYLWIFVKLALFAAAAGDAVEVEWRVPEGTFAFRVCRPSADPLVREAPPPLSTLEPDDSGSTSTSSDFTWSIWFQTESEEAGALISNSGEGWQPGAKALFKGEGDFLGFEPFCKGVVPCHKGQKLWLS